MPSARINPNYSPYPTPGPWKNCLHKASSSARKLKTCLSKACVCISRFFDQRIQLLSSNQICLLLMALMTLGEKDPCWEGQWQFPFKSSRDHLIAAQLAAEQGMNNREVTPLPVWVVSCLVSAFVSSVLSRCLSPSVLPSPGSFSNQLCNLQAASATVRRSQVQKLL